MSLKDAITVLLLVYLWYELKPVNLDQKIDDFTINVLDVVENTTQPTFSSQQVLISHSTYSET